MRTVTALLICALALPAAPKPEQVRWEDTPRAFLDRFVVVQLAEGPKIEGRWISVTPGTFTIRVEKSSDRHIVPKGARVLPRASIVKLETGRRQVRGKVIGWIAGFYAAFGTGVAIHGAGHGLSESVEVGGLLGGALGALAGRAWDRATHEIVLIP